MEGGICVGDETATLERLGEHLDGQLDECVIYFGSCSVMGTNEDDIDALLERTGASAAMGYTEDVDWVDSAAMDLIALGQLAYYEKLGNALNRLEGAKEYESLRKPPVGFRVQRHPRRR
jgi:hypothetical protein